MVIDKPMVGMYNIMVSNMTLTKALKHIGQNLSSNEGFLLSLGVGALVMLLGVFGLLTWQLWPALSGALVR